MTKMDVTGKKLVAEFTENYMEKLFYFCLKKTGSCFEAEDLTSDISLNILVALKKGAIPASFSAWVWQIARNRYSVWAEKKHRRMVSVTGSDVGDCEIEDEKVGILDELIHSEELALLRRELAFISSDYRNILVAYYIDNRRVSDIAATFNLPEGTVTSKLYRARKILKEGMSMAREFGVKSYKPEEISFINNCSAFGEKGQPWSILTHSLYKNIFLEAYGNPKTAEELALEMGIALPYMEDELAFLTEQTFLNKNGDKYETAFPIISRETQEKNHEKMLSVMPELVGLLEKWTDDLANACEAHGVNYYGGWQTYEDAKWTLLMRACDQFKESVMGDTRYVHSLRPDNGRWDIVGYQSVTFEEVPEVGLHGCMEKRADRPDVHFQQYKYACEDIQYLTPDYISHEDALTLKMIAQGEVEACESHYIKRLLQYGYIRKAESGYEPAIVVFQGYDADRYLAEFTEDERGALERTAKDIERILEAVRTYCREVIIKDLPPVFQRDENMCELAYKWNAIDRGYVLEQAIKDGWLRYDENTSKAIGAYLYL